MRNRSQGSTILSRYFSEIRDYPLLTKDEERALAEQIREGNADALNELVESNLSFVAKVASEYRYLGMPFEDLLNEGNVGLIQAAHRFDPDRETKFISYAIWWIRKSILRALSEKAHTVRLPYSQIKKFKEIRKAEKTLERTLGRAPTREDISKHLDKPVEKIDRVLRHGVHEVSLDVPVGEDHDTPLSDILVDEDGATPEFHFLDREANDGVGEVFCQLNRQQQSVIAYRFGLTGEPPLTLQETGERLGVSRERVRQIEVQAKERMRKLFFKKRRPQAPLRRARRPETEKETPVRDADRPMRAGAA